MRAWKQASRQISPLGEFCLARATGSHQAHTDGLSLLGHSASPCSGARLGTLASSSAHAGTPGADMQSGHVWMHPAHLLSSLPQTQSDFSQAPSASYTAVRGRETQAFSPVQLASPDDTDACLVRCALQSTHAAHRRYATTTRGQHWRVIPE